MLAFVVAVIANPTRHAEAIDDGERLVVESGRLIVEGVGLPDPQRGTAVPRTMVIDSGRIVEIADPGTVVARANDRIISGVGRVASPGRMIRVEPGADLLDLRTMFVAGVTTAILPETPSAERLVDLAGRSDFRIPTLRMQPAEANGLGDAGDDPSQRRTTLAVGQPGDLLLRTVDAGAIRLMFRVDPDRQPGGVEIIYPGELGVLGPLLDRLERDATRSRGEWAKALAYLAGPLATFAPAPDASAWRTASFTVDAIPRGVVWTAMVTGTAEPQPEDPLERLAWGTARTGWTLLRLFEPLNLWALVIESERHAGRLESVRTAILELNRPEFRGGRSESPEEFWSGVLPVERQTIEVAGEGLRLLDVGVEDGWRLPRPADRWSDPPGAPRAAMLISGVPTAGALQVLRSRALRGGRHGPTAVPGGERVLRLEVTPGNRRIGWADMTLRRSDRPIALPNRPWQVAATDWTPRSWPTGGVSVDLEDALAAERSTIWLDEEGRLLGLVQETTFGFIALVPDDEPGAADQD